MRIFQAFLVLVTSVLLFMLPVNEAIRDYRTYVKTDSFTSPTAPAITTANVTLTKALYDNDTSSFVLSSDLSTDVPVFSSYNGTTRALMVAGLSDNTTRILTIDYEVNSLTTWASVGTLMDKLPMIWLLLIIAFPMAGIAAIFTGRA